MEPFPKRKLTATKMIDVVSVDIDLLCCCSIPDVKGLGPWIACDYCDNCFLQECEGIDGCKIPKNQSYRCKKCQF